MTRQTNARIAGFLFLFHIAVGVTMLVLDRSTRADATPERLELIAGHVTVVRVTLLLSLLVVLIALTLAVSLYAITRDQDRDLARLALTCRIGEGMLGAVGVLTTLGLLWLATSGAAAAGAGSTAGLGGLLVQVGEWNTRIAAFLFAVGSTLFSWLFLRGRMIPTALAWLGVAGSVLLVVGLPLEIAGFLTGPVTQLMWVPIAAFELTLGPWLLVRGVR